MIQLTALEIILHSWCRLMYLAYLSSNFSLACQCTCGVNESTEESNRKDTPQTSIHLTLKNIIGSVALSSQFYFYFFLIQPEKYTPRVHSGCVVVACGQEHAKYKGKVVQNIPLLTIHQQDNHQVDNKELCTYTDCVGQHSNKQLINTCFSKTQRKVVVTG